MLIYLVPAYQALLPIDDPDIWWHLRTGQWIIEHGQVPFQDPFSAYGAGKPWIAYSWLYEILVYGLFRAFGLVGIVWFTVIMSLLIALALHFLVRRAKLPFLMELVVVALALSSMKPIISPRSWLFSILFFAVELNVAFRVKRSLSTWAGYPGWDLDPELASARLVIAELGRPLASHLCLDTRFKLVYEDDTAAVLVSAAENPGNK